MVEGNFGVHQGTSGNTHEPNEMDVVEEAPSNYQTFEAQQHEDTQFSSMINYIGKARMHSIITKERSMKYLNLTTIYAMTI